MPICIAPLLPPPFLPQGAPRCGGLDSRIHEDGSLRQVGQNLYGAGRPFRHRLVWHEALRLPHLHHQILLHGQSYNFRR